MKKLLMFAAIMAALVSCQSNKKKNAEMEMADSLAMMEIPVVEVDEVFTGTLPAANGTDIDYVLTLGITTDGVDTLYTLDMTYLDANGPGKHQTFHSKGKQHKIQKKVNNQPKTAVKLTPDNGGQPMYFVVVNDTTLRLVNDSTLQENITQTVYDITKVK